MSLTEDNVLSIEPYKTSHFLPIDCHWLDAQGKYDEDAAAAKVAITNAGMHKEPSYKTNVARAKIDAVLAQRALDKELAEYL